jgi:hypothetical protein
MRKFLLFVILIVAVFSELTFLQEKEKKADREYPAGIFQTRPCYKSFKAGNECEGLNPKAAGCVWGPGSKNGWCYHTNGKKNKITNLFDA